MGRQIQTIIVINFVFFFNDKYYNFCSYMFIIIFTVQGYINSALYKL